MSHTSLFRQTICSHESPRSTDLANVASFCLDSLDKKFLSFVKRIADDRYRVGDGNIGPVNGADTHRKTAQRRRLVIGYVIREWAYQTLLPLYPSVHKPRPLSLCPPKTDAAYENSILLLKFGFVCAICASPGL